MELKIKHLESHIIARLWQETDDRKDKKERKGKKGKMDAEDSGVQTTIFKMNKLQEYVV